MKRLAFISLHWKLSWGFPSEHFTFKSNRFQNYSHTFSFSSLSIVHSWALTLKKIFAVLIENKNMEERSTENSVAFDVSGILLWIFHNGPERTMLNFLILDWIYSSGSQKIISGLVKHKHFIQKPLRENKYGTVERHTFRDTFSHVVTGLKKEAQINISSIKCEKTDFPSENKHNLYTGSEANSKFIILSRTFCPHFYSNVLCSQHSYWYNICLWRNFH